MHNFKKLFTITVLLSSLLISGCSLANLFEDQEGTSSKESFDVKDGELTGYHGDKEEVVIPSEYEGQTITEIGKEAFLSLVTLKSVTLPETLTTIGYCAFYNCVSLESIVIPNKVTTIDTGAFYHCTSLSYIVLGDGVVSIGKSAFRYCWNFYSIVLPERLSNIGEYAFANCYHLTEVVNKSSLEITLNSESNGWVLRFIYFKWR